MEEKFLNYMKEFEMVDFLGFAKLLKVDEKIIKQTLCFAASHKDIEMEIVVKDLAVEILYLFGKENRATRKRILRLAKEVYLENLGQKRGGDE